MLLNYENRKKIDEYVIHFTIVQEMSVWELSSGEILDPKWWYGEIIFTVEIRIYFLNFNGFSQHSDRIIIKCIIIMHSQEFLFGPCAG